MHLLIKKKYALNCYSAYMCSAIASQHAVLSQSICSA